jgi:hypothetical protein
VRRRNLTPLEYSNSKYHEKHSIEERRMLRLSFDQIRYLDPLNIEKKYLIDPQSLDIEERSGKKYAIANETFLHKFYTVFSFIPIFLTLAALCFVMWFFSPKEQNLKIYQKDIFEWNRLNIADTIANYEFRFDIAPSPSPGFTELTFLDEPMSFETDEIRLRNRFFYKQAFFYQGAALKNLNISDIFWVEDTIARLQSGPQVNNETDQGHETIYESEHFCLNVEVRKKGTGEYNTLHSNNPEDDFITEEPKVAESQLIDEDAIIAGNSMVGNPFKHEVEESPQPEEPQAVQYPCLTKFFLWQENVVSIVSDIGAGLEEFTNTILETDSRTQCELDQLGIYLNDKCHYYQALDRLCIKVDVLPDDDGNESIVFDSGCFAD